MVELLVDPLAIVFILVVLVLVLSLVTRGGAGIWGLRVLSGAVVAGFLISAAPSVVNPLLELQENHTPASQDCRAPDAPLVVLSGGVSSRVESADDLSRVYEATFVRMVEAIDLINERPGNYPVYLLGGSQRNGVAEADVMQTFFIQSGIDPARLELERESANTAASALRLASLLGVPDAETGTGTHQNPPRIRLLTSALHMTRSAAVFRSAGFDVCPIPVGAKAIPDVSWWRLLPQTTALRKFDELLHEWIGLAYYRLQGYL